MPVLIGVDVGTTHLKAAAFTPDGRQVAIATVPTPTNRLPDGGAEYDPEAIWAGVADCLARVQADLAGGPAAAPGGPTAAAPGGPTAAAPGGPTAAGPGGPTAAPVLTVGVASMAEAGVLVDAEGRAVYPAIAWFDPRTRPQADALGAQFGREAIYRRTGLFVMPKFGLPKLRWIKEHQPEAYARGATWLSMAEWVAFKLTGRRASCPTLAARTMAYDLTASAALTAAPTAAGPPAGAWATDLLAAAGLRQELFGELVPEGAAVGGISPDVAARTGLPAGTPVALAGHDHPAAALAAGVSGPGQMLDSTGTAEAIIGAVNRPLLTAEAFASQIPQGPMPVPGLYGLQAGMSASGGSLEWLMRELLPGATYADVTHLAEEAGEGPTGLYYLPHLAGGGPPAVDPASRGALVGLRYGTTRGQIVKAVLEGTAYELRRMIEAMENLVGEPFTRIVVTGGQTHNPRWLQIKADVLGRELVVGEVTEATLLGAALLGGVAGGLFPGPAAAAQSLSRQERVIRPNGAHADAYNRHYQIYRSLAPALAPLYHQAERG